MKVLTRNHPLHLEIFPIVLAVGLTGCTFDGGAINDNNSWQVAALRSGSLMVDARTEKVFVLQSSQDESPTPTPTDESTPAPEEGEQATRLVYAIDPDSGSASLLADVSDTESLSLLFPENSVMLLGVRDGQPYVRQYDPNTLALFHEQAINVPYPSFGVSMGTSYLGFTDWPVWDDAGELTTQGSISLLDTATTQVHEIQLGSCYPAIEIPGDPDRLVAILSCEGEEVEAEPFIRVITWSLESLETSGFSLDEAGLFAGATSDITLDGVSPDWRLLLGQFDVSPDHQFAVLPVLREVVSDTGSDGGEGDSNEEEGEQSTQVIHELKIVNLISGAVNTIENAYGPVGFTPDGTTIVSYTHVEVENDSGEIEELDALLLIDTTSFATETVNSPTEGELQYYVTREGNFVVIDSVESTSYSAEESTEAPLIVYDIDSGSMVEIADATVSLSNFISRTGYRELWLVDEGLYRLDYEAASLDAFDLGFTPANIRYLSKRDRLVLSEANSSTIRFVNPADVSVTLSTTLPSVETTLE